MAGDIVTTPAVIVGLHGHGVFGLGVHGWWWLALAIGSGSGLLWYFPEHQWGQYAKRQESLPVPDDPEPER